MFKSKLYLFFPWKDFRGACKFANSLTGREADEEDTLLPSGVRSCPPGGGRQLSPLLGGDCSQTYADLTTILILGGSTSSWVA